MAAELSVFGPASVFPSGSFAYSGQSNTGNTQEDYDPGDLMKGEYELTNLSWKPREEEGGKPNKKLKTVDNDHSQSKPRMQGIEIGYRSKVIFGVFVVVMRIENGT